MIAFLNLVAASLLPAQINFTRHTITNNLRAAYWVHAQDIDKDGDLDLASAAFDGLDWWENNGQGGFSKHRVGSAKAAWSVFAEDLTGDGKVDIVGGSTADKEIILFKNNGNGFQRRLVETNFQDPESIVAADFDKDGDKDLLSCAVNDGVVAWWENRGGGFVKHHIDDLPRAHSIFAADLDRDGKIDVVASGSSKLRWYRNDGRGNFARKNLSSDGAWCVFAADVDGDGDNDILRTQRNNGDVDWFENSGNGRFSERNLATGFGESWSVVAGDLDGDGDADIAAAGFEGNVIHAWFNQGGGKFDAGAVVENVDTPRGVWIADLDRDGDGDIAAAIRGDRDLVWYEAKGKPKISAKITIESPNGGEVLAAGSSSDILWSSRGSINKVSVELSTDNGSSWSPIVATTGNDGKYDWLVPGPASDECLVRIADASGGGTVDISNSVFAIVADSDPDPGGAGPGLSFSPTDDARVSASNPTKNYGDKGTLRVDKEKLFSYLKFNISGISGTVAKAMLRLYVENGGDEGGAIYSVSNDYSDSGSPWTESGLTFKNAPGIAGTPINTLGLVEVDEFVEFDVTGAVSGDGVVSFGISSDSPDRVEYTSKEGAVPPTLIIETKAGDTPKPKKFSLNVTVDGSGTVSLDPPDGPYPEGAHVTLTANPAAGNEFVSWSGDASGSTTEVTVTMNGKREVTATFQPSSGDTGDSGSPVFFPIADAHVKSSKPSTNYGTSDNLRLRSASTSYRGYLKFNVTGISGGVQKALLRLYVNDASADGGSVHTVSNFRKGSSSQWTERDLTWNNAPDIGGSALASAGEVKNRQEVEFDVTAAVTGNGTVSFGLINKSSNSAKYDSKEGSNPPQLVVISGGGTGGGGNRAPIAFDDNARTSSGIAVTIHISANDTDSDGTVDVSTIKIVQDPASGAVLVNKFSGVATYTPNAGFAGEDSFTYTVRDNESATSNQATVAITVAGASSAGKLSFGPTDDAQIKFSSPTKNYGSKGTAKTEEGVFATYLKFKVAGTSGAITSAVLRMYVAGASKDAGSVYAVSDNFSGSGASWNENALNASNAPAVSGSEVARIGRASSGEYIDVDVTSAVRGNGLHSFAIVSESSDRAKFETKEGSNSPELVVEFGGSTAVTSGAMAGALTETLSASPGQLPESIALGANYPNPFNAGTSIQYALPENGHVRLFIYNLLGQIVRKLVDSDQTAGFKVARWDGKSEAGTDVGSGLYFARLEVAGTRLTRQIALQK